MSAYDKVRERMAKMTVDLGKSRVAEDCAPRTGRIPEKERASTVPYKDPAFRPPDLTGRYRLPGGTQSLRELQNLVLHDLEHLPFEEHQPRGVVGLLGVGAGKTLLTILGPLATRAERPLLIIPADMREAFVQEYSQYGKHWRRPKNLRILSYNDISVASGEDKLRQLNPDFVAMDEVHNLASGDSARTKKMARFFQENPSIRALALSGTMTKKSVQDFAHIFGWILRDYNPLPMEKGELANWSSILDADGLPFPGAWSDIRGIYRHSGGSQKEEQEKAREAFGKHLASTKYVVSLPSKEKCEATIYLHQAKYTPPPAVEDALRAFEESWTRPDGEEIKWAFEAFRLRQQLSQGFYYKWDWNAPPWRGKVDKEWMDKRQRWNRACRAVLKRNLPGLESPLLVIRAIQAGTLDDGEASDAWDQWVGVKARPVPPTVPVWLDDSLARFSVDWAKKHKNRGLIWFQDKAMGEKLAEHGMKVYGAGQMPVLDGQVIAVSIRAHGTGKNLQAYNKNLVLSFQGSAARMEQLIGRTHRPGQNSDEVLVDFVAATPSGRDAVRAAVRRAQYLDAVQGNPQKLTLATWATDFDRFSLPEKGGADEDTLVDETESEED